MNWRPYALIVFVFIASRLWLWSIGVTFDDYRTPTENKVHIMQMLDRQALEHDIIESLLYMHMQPPVYSLVMYVTRMNPSVLNAVWSVLGLVSAMAIYDIVARLLCVKK